MERDTKTYVAEGSPEKVFIHAGVVGWRGKAILIPGKSFAGKTSLVAAFVKVGASYYSDEFAVLDSQARVHPYLSPLGMREEGATLSQKVSIEELGGVPGFTPIPVGLVLSAPYKKYAAGWKPRRISPGRAMLELLANTVCARSRPEAVLPTLRKAVMNARCLKGTRGEAFPTANAVVEFIERGMQH